MTDTSDSRRRWEIHQLWAAYAHRADDGDAEAWSELFTADAIVELGPRTLNGLPEIRDFARRRNAGAGRHLIVNIEATSDPGLEYVNVIADFVVVPIAGWQGAPSLGRYHSLVRWGGDGWLISRHRIERA